jgi:hypothetical protein
MEFVQVLNQTGFNDTAYWHTDITMRLDSPNVSQVENVAAFNFKFMILKFRRIAASVGLNVGGTCIINGIN